ncbi:MAG: sugar transferase [Verrucomicrobiales bacterium]|nr:sugar transferase [Verrucomicrobiales bacterium]
MKRLFDIIVSVAAMAFLSPAVALVWLAIFLERSGPVFYRQVRVGLGGKTFDLYKFRSMAVGADKDGYSTARNDSRITKVGAFIRKWSLDEIPQLWNVLKGDMSLVGPRPDVPAQRELYEIEDWEKRCSVKPGITGEAQVRYRSSCTFQQRLVADLDYVKSEKTVCKDLSILLKTIFKLKSW